MAVVMARIPYPLVANQVHTILGFASLGDAG